MLFNSPLFIFCFLPITLIGYFAFGRFFGKRPAMIWLLVLSLTFYGWWNPRYLILIIGSILFNHAIAWELAKIPQEKRKPLLTFGVAGNLALLGYFKYAHFLLDTFRHLTGIGSSFGAILLPLGISFFTFTQIAYLVDTYRSKTEPYRLRDYALFVTYFPHLIAGPIVHHWQILPQFKASRVRISWDNMAVGLTVFCLGLAEKTLIADNVAPSANAIFAQVAKGHHPTFFEGWFAAIAYTIQIYFDFAGYSNMAIGLSKMFDVKLPLNFNSPYKSTSIIDFWRRWHMTLSEFLRNYLYIPLGGNRKGKARRYVNLMATMLLGGLWHGAGWTFVVWGGLHGIYLTVNHAWREARKPAPTSSAVVKVASWALTFASVVVAWVFFRSSNFSAAARMLRGMACLNGVGHVMNVGVLMDAPDYALLLGALLYAWFGPNVQQIMAVGEPAIDTVPVTRLSWWRPRWSSSLVVAILFFCAVRTFFAADPSPFLYFNF